MSEDWGRLIEGWFRETGGGGLVLPDGWFGRPYDNIHELTFLAVRPLWLIIELDNLLLLTIRETRQVQRHGDTLIVSGFSSCILDRKEYAGDECHVATYASGEIKFVAPPGR